MSKFIASATPDHFGSEAFDSADKAIKATIEKERLNPGDIVYIGSASEPQFPPNLIDPNLVVVDLVEMLSEQAPIEAFGDWPEISKVQEEEIGKSLGITVEVMMRRMGIWPPTFFVITGVEEVEVLGEDEEFAEEE